MGGQNNSIVMILLTKQYTDENCKFIKFARIFTYERQFGKRKSMLFLTILSKKKFHSVGGGGYYTVDNFVEYIILWRKKTFTVDFVYRKTILRKNFIFANTKFFSFF